MLRFFRIGVFAFEASEPDVQGFVAEPDRNRRGISCPHIAQAGGK